MGDVYVFALTLLMHLVTPEVDFKFNYSQITDQVILLNDRCNDDVCYKRKRLLNKPLKTKNAKT